MRGRWSVFVLLVSFSSLLSGCGPVPKDEAGVVTPPSLPRAVNDWVAAGEPEHYDTESIYSYIDGHAEVYMAYGMKDCFSQRYSGPDGSAEIVVDLFEMASSDDAFGVFSHDRAGETVEVGQGGVFRHGWLSFWKGDWYASVYSTDGDEGSRQAVLDIGLAVAESFVGGAGEPALLVGLPSEGLVPSSVCFLRSPQILNAHVFVGGDNLFDLSPEVEAVVGKYDLDELTAELILIRYPGEAEAQTAEDRARRSEGGDQTRPAMLIGRRGVFLAALVGAEPGGQSEALLAEALEGGK